MRCMTRHPSVGQPSMVCAPCEVHDAIVKERKEFSTVVGWMFDKSVCFYCGEHATQKEHVVPQSTLYPTWIVPSCVECNVLAGAKPFVSVLDKMHWLKDRRARRYAKLLKMPEWTEDEIAELGHALRSKVEAAQSALTSVRSQLTWDPLALREMVGGAG